MVVPGALSGILASFVLAASRARPRTSIALVLVLPLAGYLAAFGVLIALARQARDGGSWHVRVSLAHHDSLPADRSELWAMPRLVG